MSNDFIISGSNINFNLQLIIKTFETEANHLLDMAEIEVLKLMQQGYTEAQARSQVARMLQNNEGFAKAFWNRQNRLIQEIENKLVALPVQEYAEQHPTEKLKWVLGEVITHHCRDCLRLSKMEPRTLKEWQAMDTGLPRQGKTECSFGCKCMLKPVKGNAGVKSSLNNPVSKSIKLEKESSKYNKILQNVMGAIDKTHDDGNLREIPLKIVYNTKHEGAFISSYERPIRIDLRGTTDTPHLTLAHETGHFIDRFGIGANGKAASESIPIMNEWRNAVRNSKAFKELVNAHNNALSAREASHYKYMLKDTELWARSYAQYIAEKSGNSILKKDLEFIRSRHILNQWNEDDFVEIKTAIDKVFKTLGWLI